MKIYEIVAYGISKEAWQHTPVGYFIDETLAKKYFDKYKEQELHSDDYKFFLYEYDIITEEPAEEPSDL